MNHPGTPQTIRVQDRIDHRQFGCTPEVFEAYVRGKDLQVRKRYQHFFVVDINDDTYAVHESELLDKYNAHGNDKV